MQDGRTDKAATLCFPFQEHKNWRINGEYGNIRAKVSELFRLFLNDVILFISILRRRPLFAWTKISPDLHQWKEIRVKPEEYHLKTLTWNILFLQHFPVPWQNFFGTIAGHIIHLCTNPLYWSLSCLCNMGLTLSLQVS